MPIDAGRPIVIIEDHPEHLEYLATLLRRAGYAVAAFDRAAPALSFLKERQTSLVITDVFMPEMDGFEVLMEVRREFPGLPLIAVSGVGPRAQPLFLEAMKRLGARAAFAKPLDVDALLATVAKLIGGIS